MWNCAFNSSLGRTGLRANLDRGVSAGFDRIDLARFALHPGEGQRLDIEADPGSSSWRANDTASARAPSPCGSTCHERPPATRSGCGSPRTRRGHACAASRTPTLRWRSTRARSISPAPTMRSSAAHTSRAMSWRWLVGPRRVRPGGPYPAPLPTGLPGPLPDLRGAAQCRRVRPHEHEREPDPRWAAPRAELKEVRPAPARGLSGDADHLEAAGECGEGELVDLLGRVAKRSQSLRVLSRQNQDQTGDREVLGEPGAEAVRERGVLTTGPLQIPGAVGDVAVLVAGDVL